VEKQVHAYAVQHNKQFRVSMLSAHKSATPSGMTSHTYNTAEEAKTAFLRNYPDGVWHDTQKSFYTVVENRYLERISEVIPQSKYREEIIKNLKFQYLSLFLKIWPKDEAKPSKEEIAERIDSLRRVNVDFASSIVDQSSS